ncbi:unnamed protein product [Rotaria sp. Silwood2]|nr:unnamed protein product [Rotaria sp. Silwood2]CAF4629221.1 unnamed protein product [Rotaria sp. Silwood2]
MLRPSTTIRSSDPRPPIHSSKRQYSIHSTNTHTPMPSPAYRTSIGATCQSNVHHPDYDYQYLIEERQRIGYTGTGLIFSKQTEVDEILSKNIDVLFGIWFSLNCPREPLTENINERQFIPKRLSQHEKLNILFSDKSNSIVSSKENANKSQISSSSSNEYHCTHLRTINNEISQLSCHLSYHQHSQQIKSHKQLSILKYSQS